VKKIFFTFLLLININMLLSADDVFKFWSLGEIGGSYSNNNEKINIDFTILQFEWINTNTRLGIGFNLFDVHYDNNDYMLEISPVNFSFLPFVFDFIEFPHSSMSNIGMQFYYRTGFGVRMKETKYDIGWDNFINVIGLKIFAFPGLSYSLNKTIFAEYNIMTNNFRVGITIDYIEPFYSLYSLYKNIKGKNE
jgi:hypothetical protein